MTVIVFERTRQMPRTYRKLTRPLAGGPVVEFLGGLVVGEQAALGHELLVGAVSQDGNAHGQHSGRRDGVQEELRPAVRVADVYGTDQDPGHGADEARDPGRGQRGVFGLYPGSHRQRQAVTISPSPAIVYNIIRTSDRTGRRD